MRWTCHEWSGKNGSVVANLFQIEKEMNRLTGKLQDAAEELQTFADANNIPYPPLLVRLLGEPEPSQSTVAKATIPPMPPPGAPPEGASPSWIWVHESRAAVTSLVLACLHQASGPITPAQIFAELGKKRIGIHKGSIANLGTRFEDEAVIRRDDDGWVLLRRDLAPVPHLGFLWGEPKIFEKTEIASYRREAVEHILRSFPGGLQIVQITDAFKDHCPWFNTDIPVSKDLIKMDMKDLEDEEIVRRKGGSGKWELTP